MSRHNMTLSVTREEWEILKAHPCGRVFIYRQFFPKAIYQQNGFKLTERNVLHVNILAYIIADASIVARADIDCIINGIGEGNHYMWTLTNIEINTTPFSYKHPKRFKILDFDEKCDIMKRFNH